jgi:hypothetical protein
METGPRRPRVATIRRWDLARPFCGNQRCNGTPCGNQKGNGTPCGSYPAGTHDTHVTCLTRAFLVSAGQASARVRSAGAGSRVRLPSAPPQIRGPYSRVTFSVEPAFVAASKAALTFSAPGGLLQRERGNRPAPLSRSERSDRRFGCCRRLDAGLHPLVPLPPVRRIGLRKASSTRRPAYSCSSVWPIYREHGSWHHPHTPLRTRR